MSLTLFAFLIVKFVIFSKSRRRYIKLLESKELELSRKKFCEIPWNRSSSELLTNSLLFLTYTFNCTFAEWKKKKKTEK